MKKEAKNALITCTVLQNIRYVRVTDVGCTLTISRRCCIEMTLKSPPLYLLLMFFRRYLECRVFAVLFPREEEVLIIA